MHVLYRDANRVSLSEIEYFQIGGKGGVMVLRNMSSCEGAPSPVNLQCSSPTPSGPHLSTPFRQEHPPISSRSLSTRSVPQGTGVGLWDGESAWKGPAEKSLCMVYYSSVHEQTTGFCPNIPMYRGRSVCSRLNPWNVDHRLARQMNYYHVPSVVH